MSTSDSPQMIEIDLNNFSAAELNQFKTQLEQELQLFHESMSSLKVAQIKLSESNEVLKKLPQYDNQQILVPLTGSIYVPGKIPKRDKVMIDIGTGYFVEKDIESAKDYFHRKITYLKEQIDKIQHLGNEKIRVKDAVSEIMETKVRNQIAMMQVNAENGENSSQ